MFNRLVKNGKNLFSKESSSILSAATIIMFATLVSALLGVIRTRLLIQYFYSDKEIVDVFWAAFRLPDMIFQIIVVGALSSAFIPVFGRYLGKKDESNLIANSMINVVMLIMIALSFVIFIWAKPLSRLIAGGFSTDQLALMVNLTRIMSLAQVFFGFSSFLTGIIQSHQRFMVPAFSPILYNFGIILGIIIFGKTLGIYGPALGVVLGAFLHLAAQIPLARKLGFRYSFAISRGHKAVREMLRLMLPRVLTLSLSQIELTAIIAFSSWLASGSVTMMSIATQLANLPVRLIGIPIGQASLPFFTKESAKDKLESLAHMVNSTILEMLYLALPASAIVLVLRIPLVRLAYGADSFPWYETVTTGKLVAILAISIAARSLTHILVRVFYALHDTMTPFIVSIFSTVTNLTLSYYFLFILKTGVIGMATAVSIAAILETFILTTTLYRLAQFAVSRVLMPLLKMLIITLITTAALWIPLRLLDQMIFDTTRTIPLIMLTITTTLIGLCVYIALSYLFAVRELSIFAKLFGKIGNWQKALSQTTEPIESPETSV
ncbi:MAG: Integral membrane protein MviN [Microgenomates group bacterium GW2011_GWF2_47_9]|nr:MAG: Integral membrane protein MviN [Microgenomates group bacterium GW2011_GWF2_47_9]